MPSCLENVIRGDDEVVEVSGDLGDKMGKEAEVPQKVTLMPRPRPPFPQRLVKRPRMVNTSIFSLCLNNFPSMSL